MRLLLSGTALVACLALTACSSNPAVDSGASGDASPSRQTPTGRSSNSPKPSVSPSPSQSPKPAKPSVKPDPSVTPTPGGSDGSGPRAATGGSGAPGKPRVFMALHGTQEVLSSEKDNQWSYVRANLDGIWGNGAGMELEDQAKVWRKVKTRNVITEVDFPANPNDKTPSAAALAGAPRVDSSLKLNREAVAMYTAEPKTWDGRSFSAVQKQYVTGTDIDPAERHKAIYTGWNLNNWVDPNYDSVHAKRMANPITGSAVQVQDQAAGQFVECGHDHCAKEGLNFNAFERAIRSSHAKNEPFIWFTSPHPETQDQLKNFQAGYNLIASKGLWRSNDVVMIINYRGESPMLPETVNGQPANTVTGMLYWALKQ
jgi:hypothetical protein